MKKVLIGLLLLSAPIALTGCAEANFIINKNNTREIIGIKDKSVKEIKVPKNITSIGVGAFANCEELEKVTIANSVTTIGAGAFMECWRLKSVKLPDNLTRIEGSTFSRCLALEEINFPSTLTYIGDEAFAHANMPVDLVIPEGVTEIGDRAFQWCNNADTIKIPSTVTKIGEQVFTINKDWRYVDFRANVSTIKAYSFSGVTTFVLPKSVKKIEKYSFWNKVEENEHKMGGLVKSLFYCGTEEEYNEIEIEEEFNREGSWYSTTVYYYSETQPTTSGNFWHYGDNGRAVAW